MAVRKGRLNKQEKALLDQMLRAQDEGWSTARSAVNPLNMGKVVTDKVGRPVYASTDVIQRTQLPPIPSELDEVVGRATRRVVDKFESTPPDITKAMRDEIWELENKPYLDKILREEELSKLPSTPKKEAAALDKMRSKAARSRINKAADMVMESDRKKTLLDQIARSNKIKELGKIADDVIAKDKSILSVVDDGVKPVASKVAEIVGKEGAKKAGIFGALRGAAGLAGRAMPWVGGALTLYTILDMINGDDEQPAQKEPDTIDMLVARMIADRQMAGDKVKSAPSKRDIEKEMINKEINDLLRSL